jgi:hypothetical protein
MVQFLLYGVSGQSLLYGDLPKSITFRQLILDSSLSSQVVMIPCQHKTALVGQLLYSLLMQRQVCPNSDDDFSLFVIIRQLRK